jgi:tRNA-Thr(GGU) m(6)t(6)A37 methyltransferase TsaA
METITLTPIGRVRTPWPEKFGVPRQAGLVPAAEGRLVFEPEFRREEAVRGLEGFTHLWLVFVFHEVREDEVRLSVRPPRLGGNEKAGVFATRSPFRPNRLGLSACRLKAIDFDGEEAPALVLGGVDVVDGTPVVDVKPYLPYADRIGGAVAGLEAERPERIAVEVAEEARDGFEALPERTQRVVLESLRWDARPAYHDGERIYHLRVGGDEVAWEVREGVCRVLEVSVFAPRK